MLSGAPMPSLEPYFGMRLQTPMCSMQNALDRSVYIGNADIG